MFKWIGSLTNAAKREVGTLTSARLAKDAAQDTYEHARVILDPRRQRKGRVETFQNAYQRLGLNEETLAKVYTNHRLRFYGCMVVFLGGIGLMIVGFLGPRWWVGLPGFAAAMVCLSQMFDASLRTYQINRRELVGVQVWWKDSTHWWPGPFVTLEAFEKDLARQARRDARRLEKKSRAVVPVNSDQV